MDAQTISDLARRLAAAVPPGMRSLQVDLERNFRSVLQSNLERLNLVTREEFDVQRKVLERTREKLAALEGQIEVLQHLRSGSG
jgi:hypothetical protein